MKALYLYFQICPLWQFSSNCQVSIILFFQLAIPGSFRIFHSLVLDHHYIFYPLRYIARNILLRRLHHCGSASLNTHDRNRFCRFLIVVYHLSTKSPIQNVRIVLLWLATLAFLSIIAVYLIVIFEESVASINWSVIE